MIALKILRPIITNLKPKQSINLSSCSEYSDFLYLTSLECQNKKNVWLCEMTESAFKGARGNRRKKAD